MDTLLTVKLAHDLENLLHIMADSVRAIRLRSRIHVVGDGDLDVAHLDAAIDSAFTVSRELLALGRPHTVEPSLIDVNEIVTQARGVIRRMIGTRIELAIDLRAADPVVQAEVVHLEWLLFNLVANARDAMPTGGVLKIETASIDDAPGMLSDSDAYPRRCVLLTVTDSGHTIVPSVLDKVFEPFASARSGRTGLGLTSVAVTVRALKGRLHVQSESRRGTSVQVYLPIFDRAAR